MTAIGQRKKHMATTLNDQALFDSAIRALESEVANVGAYLVLDPAVRQAYARQISHKLRIMAMRVATELTTKPIEASSADEVPTSEILLNEEASGKFVSGAVLEAAVWWNGFYLLFMTDDIPFEESLRILLLDAELNILDSAFVGGPYSSGSFSSLDLIEPNSVHFRFIGDTVWSVELFPHPVIRLPLLASEPVGVYRSLGFRRHFVVHGNPQPQSSDQTRK